MNYRQGQAEVRLKACFHSLLVFYSQVVVPVIVSFVQYVINMLKRITESCVVVFCKYYIHHVYKSNRAAI